MEFNAERLEDFIKDYYKNTHEDLEITKIICERIADIMKKNESYLLVPKDVLERKVVEFLDKENTIRFIRERQPLVSPVSNEVVDNITDYLKNKMPSCELNYVCRKSNHPEDSYLYSIVAKKNDEYICFTSWNETTKSLNHGHYGLKNRDAALEILKANFFDITGEPERFGFTLSSRDVSAENEKQQHMQEQEEVAKRAGRRQHR